MDIVFNSETAAAFARFAATIIAAIAAAVGLSTDPDAIYTAVACVLTLACFVYSWWKNNNITEAAQTAQLYLESLKVADEDEE